MIINFLAGLFGKKNQDDILSIDIGSHTIKLMELDINHQKPLLKSAGISAAPQGAIKNNIVVRPSEVASVIRSTMDANDIRATRVVTAIPGPCVFTKKITVSSTSVKELEENIQFEARNYVPHNINDIHLDYQILKTNGKSSMEVLLVAVKNEIISSFAETIAQADLEFSIADVDYFALENMFLMNYPEEKGTIAILNIGSRYSSVNLLQDGKSIFTGDISVGGKLYTNALCETLDLKPEEAEQAKMGNLPSGLDQHLVTETIERTTEHVASELHRQLGFFWNAAATDKSIESIYICGGGSLVHGLIEELNSKVGINCKLIDTFKRIATGPEFDRDYLAEIGPSMALSIGLASRRLGDKVHAVE
ncbi:MAG: type IV pilus assembly protein PilM [Deltaproteobacteria bacterium]|nr:type IV pilus assembly protein PilM [Deltaproteobacteria bacterium]